jgi:hypothetical protein
VQLCKLMRLMFLRVSFGMRSGFLQKFEDRKIPRHRQKLVRDFFRKLAEGGHELGKEIETVVASPYLVLYLCRHY